MTLEELFTIIKERQKTMPKNSYTSTLFREGKDRILQKVGEEAVEVVIAAKGKNKKRVIDEMADLWFHSLVLMSYLNISPDDIFKELENRHKN